MTPPTYCAQCGRPVTLTVKPCGVCHTILLAELREAIARAKRLRRPNRLKGMT